MSNTHHRTIKPRPRPHPHPTAMIFDHINYENQTLNSKCNELTDIIKSLKKI